MRYAIGDIHGGSRTLWALLTRLNLRHGDRLYLLGDYVDRGNDSVGVLDALIGLIDAGYDLRPVRGNHDDMMLRAVTGDHDSFSRLWMEIWGKHTLASFGIERPELLPQHYVNLLAAMPCLQVDDAFVFVHAGLDMRLDDPMGQSNPTGMLWSDVNVVDPEKTGGRKLLSGHTIRSLTAIEAALPTHRLYLDNGAFTGDSPDFGNLVALNLDTMELVVQSWLDGPAND